MISYPHCHHWKIKIHKVMDTNIVTIDLGQRSYDIYIGTSLIYQLLDSLPFNVSEKQFFVIADTNTQKYAHIVNETLQEAGADDSPIKVVKAGEGSKAFHVYQNLCDWLIEKGANRKSALIAVGGGVVGDLAGFAAASVMRGMDFIQIPTTLLAQVDSSVGGKTGINSKHGKNLIGAFYQPQAVIADIDTLQTLPKRELLAGYAEVVKYGLIGDAPFFQWLEENGDRVCSLDEDALAYAIETSVKAKALIVEADEHEAGRRALLNLGHTFGHALEAAAHYDGRLLHGEAVAIGTIMALDTSARLGFCDIEELERVEQHFMRVGLPTRASQIEPAIATNVDHLIGHMMKDKKAVKDEIKFILLNEIGSAFMSENIDMDVVREVIKDSLLSETQGITERWNSAF